MRVQIGNDLARISSSSPSIWTSGAVVRTLNYGRSEELGAGAGGGPILATMLGESARVAKILVTDQSNDSF